MASEQAEAAAMVEAVAARETDLVVALLAPGGLLSAEDAGKAVADRLRSSLADASRKNVAMSRQDAEKLAIKAATATLTIIAICKVGSLNAPHGGVEEAITKAVAAAYALVGDKFTALIQAGLLNLGVVEKAITEAVADACAQVGGTSTSSAYSSALWCLVVVFFLWVTTIAMFVFCLGY